MAVPGAYSTRVGSAEPWCPKIRIVEIHTACEALRRHCNRLIFNNLRCNRVFGHYGDDRPVGYPRINAADMNGDGKPDLVVGGEKSQGNTPAIWVYYQR